VPVKIMNDGTVEFKLSGTSFRVGEELRPIGLVGKGSYGIVASCVNILTQERVAVKKIKPMCGDAWDGKQSVNPNPNPFLLP
jgi:hypothetical protein